MTTGQRRRATSDFPPGRLGVFVAILLISTALFAAPGWAGSEACIRAEVKQSVRLPHGELIAPGTLRLCRQKLSPVSHLHHTTIDGRPIALLMSLTKITASDDSRAPVVVLHKDEDGQLELVGYTLTGAGESHTHLFTQYGRKVRTKVRVSEPQILIAAALD